MAFVHLASFRFVILICVKGNVDNTNLILVEGGIYNTRQVWCVETILFLCFQSE